ncbi:hypothetical protein HOLleu_05396 [Holothuria leucospilota]|uniref:Endonuclease/exonuclease/phosphatase domain-containing protein n=1 Tax=Holothuria leucospilota TaxID=206669 RepID=A0A9Q1CKN2_HOLLE|nr:hypothetical protein HOLleu_05396 [Holothuria leucospilota]
MGNVQSLKNKMDELHSCVRYLQEFRQISLMSFTETWLDGSVADNCVSIDGFKLVRGDRDLNLAEKQKGGGVCLYVNEQWCHPNNVTVKHYSCTTNVEILAVGLRPYYLPREFSHVIHLTVYVPNRNVAKDTAVELCSTLQDLEIAHPNSFIVVDGDFNHCTLKNNIGNYYQHVQCCTRGQATLDLCYSNVKEAYSAKPITKLGKSDHNMILLQPKYRPIIQRQKPKLLTVKQWSSEAIDELQASLDLTDWEVFIESTQSIDELTQTVTGYTNFCVDCVVPTKRIKVYPNNKPWITKEVKSIINKKKQIFGQGDMENLKSVQKELDKILRREKDLYRRKIEKHFTENNMKHVWAGIRMMSGYSNDTSKNSRLPSTSTIYANELNVFYNRFDCHDFSGENKELHEILSNRMYCILNHF